MKNFIFLLLLILPFIATSQYCNTASSNEAITPSSTIQYTTTYANGRRAFNFTATAGVTYTFSTIGLTTVDTYLRLYDGPAGGNLVAFNDDTFGLQSEIVWECPTTGDYSILLTRYSCRVLNGNTQLAYEATVSADTPNLVTIGAGTGVVYDIPSYGLYEYSWSTMIYQQSEIDMEGQITQIRFNVQNTPTNYTMPNQKIYMAHTALSSFPNSSVEEAEELNHISSDWTLVYDGTLVWNIGWNEINLDLPFEWNNVDNLLIKVENYSGTWSWNYPGFYYTSNPGTVAYNWQDGSYPFTDGIRSSERPNIKLLFESINTLPVALISFNSKCDGGIPVLEWSTASEQNSDYFQIERSQDGFEWKQVFQINAAGNSNTGKNYQFYDITVVRFKGYYRLKQVDYDGQFEYFGPVSSNCLEPVDKLKSEVFPNPTSSDIFIGVRHIQDENAQILITDNSGRIILQEDIQLINGYVLKSVNLSTYQTGVYQIYITTLDHKYIHKVIKK